MGGQVSAVVQEELASHKEKPSHWLAKQRHMADTSPRRTYSNPIIREVSPLLFQTKALPMVGSLTASSEGVKVGSG